MARFSAVRAAYGQFLRRREVTRQIKSELGGMTDGELNDLGISRVDITRLAREAAAAA